MSLRVSLEHFSYRYRRASRGLCGLSLKKGHPERIFAVHSIRKNALVLSGLVLLLAGSAWAQQMTLPEKVEAGSAFSIATTGSGKAALYVVGLGQVLRQDVELGQPVSFAAGALHNAGRYTAVLVGAGAPESGAFWVTPAAQVANVSFLARPSRVPTGLHGGITGAVYLFDDYQNLITASTPVSFQLSGAGVTQTRSAVAHNGAAWTQMDSAAKESAAQFSARVGAVASTRVIQEVPGEPCGLHVSARPAGRNIDVTTDPLRDCGGNAVPDGTIVTFTEAYDGQQTTVDVPLKHGIAQTELPAYNGAKISAATGVVLGNEIRWTRP
jgi:hypothetical protein